ncbi:sodium:calcium antiporter [Bradyrhizobium sp. USDA 10063]
MVDFTELSLFTNFAIFSVAACFVWAAGTRLSRYADVISSHTGLGHALLGLLLLGGITSLPEMAVSVSSALSGNATLAVNNILGGVTMQVAILAVADFAIGRRALTAVVPDPIVLLQGALNIVLLCIVPVAILVGDVPLLGVGLWVWAIAALAIFSFRKLGESEGRRPWQPTKTAPAQELDGKPGGQPKADRDSTRQAALPVVLSKTLFAAGIILVAGFLISRTAEAIAEQTGLGSSFVGAVLVAISTSLPEVSTVLSAARLGHYTMAISDILGTNLFDVGLLFVIDAAASGEPVLNRVGPFAAVGAMLGIAVTSLFIAGLAERRDRTVLRMGVDSVAVLLVYCGGLVLLYSLRTAS